MTTFTQGQAVDADFVSAFIGLYQPVAAYLSKRRLVVLTDGYIAHGLIGVQAYTGSTPDIVTRGLTSIGASVESWYSPTGTRLEALIREYGKDVGNYYHATLLVSSPDFTRRLLVTIERARDDQTTMPVAGFPGRVSIFLEAVSNSSASWTAPDYLGRDYGPLPAQTLTEFLAGPTVRRDYVTENQGEPAKLKAGAMFYPLARINEMWFMYEPQRPTRIDGYKVHTDETTGDIAVQLPIGVIVMFKPE